MTSAFAILHDSLSATMWQRHRPLMLAVLGQTIVFFIWFYFWDEAETLLWPLSAGEGILRVICMLGFLYVFAKSGRPQLTRGVAWLPLAGYLAMLSLAVAAYLLHGNWPPRYNQPDPGSLVALYPIAVPVIIGGIFVLPFGVLAMVAAGIAHIRQGKSWPRLVRLLLCDGTAYLLGVYLWLPELLPSAGAHGPIMNWLLD